MILPAFVILNVVPDIAAVKAPSSLDSFSYSVSDLKTKLKIKFRPPSILGG